MALAEQSLYRRRRIGAALILALVLVAVIGVWRLAPTAGSQPGTPAGEDPPALSPPGQGEQPAGPELVLGSLGGIGGWNPLLNERHPLQALLFNGLVRYNDQMQVEPDLAESWQASEDGRVYTFKLRAARWQDGEPVTAADVVFSLTARLHPRADRLAAYNLAPLKGAAAYLAELDRLDRERAAGTLEAEAWAEQAESAYRRWLAQGAVRATDERTVVVEFDEPFAPALELFTLAVIPAHAFSGPEEALDPEHPFNTRAPVGSGPYRLESWVPDVRARFVARDDLPAGQAPGYRYVTVRFFRDQDALDRALLEGEVDAGRISPEAASQAAARQEPLRLVEYPDLGYTYVVYNLADPVLSDPAVRQALNLAVDRERMVRELFGRYAQPLTSPGLPGMWWTAPAPPPRHDPAGAREILDRAGWRDEDGDGVRERGGQPLTFQLLTHRENRYREAAAAMLRESLAAAGVRVEVRLVEWPELVAALRSGRFQAALLGVGVGVDPDGYPLWHSGGHLNFTGLHDAELDRLLEEGRRGGDRRELYARVQRRLVELQPALFLWQETQVFATRPGLGGPVSGSPGGFFWNVTAWHPEDRPAGEPAGAPANPGR
mgnify:CR=1 FL=1